MPPPIVGAASRTTTERPASAIATAAASPLGPEPTTIASEAGKAARPGIRYGPYVEAGHRPPHAHGRRSPRALFAAVFVLRMTTDAAGAA